MKKTTVSLILILITCLTLLFGCEFKNEEHTHAFGEWEITKENSCTLEGSKTRSCSCGEVEQETIPATGHTEEVIESVAPTCTESGLTEGKKCSVCGDVLAESETIPATGHNFKFDVDELGNLSDFVVCQNYGCEESAAFASGLYDAEGILLASWDELVNVYGLENTLNNASKILQKNDGLKNGSIMVIDDSVSEIVSYSFKDCDSLTKVVISDSVLKINTPLFYNCTSLEKIIVDDDNPNFKSVEGNLYDKSGTKLLQCASGKKENVFAVPYGVTEIGAYAFSSCGEIEKITIPTSVIYIEAAAFSSCESLKEIYFDGTEQEWDALEYMDRYMSNDVLVYFDGKIQFMANWFYQASGSSSTRLKITIDGEKMRVEGGNSVVYDNISLLENMSFTNRDSVLNGLSGEEKKYDAFNQILACDEWNLCDGKAENGLVGYLAVCRKDNALYFLTVSKNTTENAYTINQINYSLVNLEV